MQSTPVDLWCSYNKKLEAAGEMQALLPGQLKIYSCHFYWMIGTNNYLVSLICIATISGWFCWKICRFLSNQWKPKTPPRWIIETFYFSKSTQFLLWRNEPFKQRGLSQFGWRLKRTASVSWREKGWLVIRGVPPESFLFRAIFWFPIFLSFSHTSNFKTNQKGMSHTSREPRF